MTSSLHDELTALGAKWLKRQGFSIVATELDALGVSEQADAIGFRANCSAIVEAKASRGDFLADGQKPHRRAGGLGLYRFYICPEGMIRPEEIPAKWGLLYANGKTIIEIVRPVGNIWPGGDTRFERWSQFQHAANIEAERRILFSIARRLVQGKSIMRIGNEGR